MNNRFKSVLDRLAGGDIYENERRYTANAELVRITQETQPWTRTALDKAVSAWLEGTDDD